MSEACRVTVVIPAYQEGEAIVPLRAHWRTDEYRLFGSGAPMHWMAEAGIRAVGMREIRDLWRAAIRG